MESLETRFLVWEKGNTEIRAMRVGESPVVLILNWEFLYKAVMFLAHQKDLAAQAVQYTEHP